MSTRARKFLTLGTWGAGFVTRFFAVPEPPKPVKPSAAGLARAAGWTMETRGVWTHPEYGVVEETRGAWLAYTDMYRRDGFRTMGAAMQWAQARAGLYAAEQAGDPLPHRTEMLEIDGEPREVRMYGFGDGAQEGAA